MADSADTILHNMNNMSTDEGMSVDEWWSADEGESADDSLSVEEGVPAEGAEVTPKQETSASKEGTPEPKAKPSTSMKRPSSGVDGGSTKKRQVTGIAQKPSKAMVQYDTSKYPLYNPQIKIVGEHNSGAHTSFKQYDDHTLFVLPAVDIEDVPTRGVRLDDNTVALVIGKCNREALNENWKAEFDTAGMTRGLRVPLGHAAKVFKNVGDKDIAGNVLAESEQGYYYLWHKGLHLLCGKEGLDAGVYLKRPSFEVPICKGLGWKKSARAIVQLPTGHPTDSTMQGIEGYDELMLAAGKWEGSAAAKRGNAKAGGGSKVSTASKNAKEPAAKKKDAGNGGTEESGPAVVTQRVKA